MTRESAAFLLNVLSGVTLTIGAPDFAEVAALAAQAKAELLALVAEDPPA